MQKSKQLSIFFQDDWRVRLRQLVLLGHSGRHPLQDPHPQLLPGLHAHRAHSHHEPPGELGEGELIEVKYGLRKLALTSLRQFKAYSYRLKNKGLD